MEACLLSLEFHVATAAGAEVGYDLTEKVLEVFLSARHASGVADEFGV